MLMGQYIEQDFNIVMGNIAVGSEYLLIPRDHCIPKAHIKADYTVDEHHLTLHH